MGTGLPNPEKSSTWKGNCAAEPYPLPSSSLAESEVERAPLLLKMEAPVTEASSISSSTSSSSYNHQTAVGDATVIRVESDFPEPLQPSPPSQSPSFLPLPAMSFPSPASLSTSISLQTSSSYPSTPASVSVSVSVSNSASLPGSASEIDEGEASAGRSSPELQLSGNRQRTNPFNSNLWLSLELSITLAQVIAAAIVLAISGDEKPQVPLGLWLAGYAAGCVATLPLLYWRYTHRFIRYRQNAASDEFPASYERRRLGENVAGVEEGEVGGRTGGSGRGMRGNGGTEEGGRMRVRAGSAESIERRMLRAAYDDTRMVILVERFKIALDCFFAVWFVVGNVWIFGGHASPSDAPNLYRLCVVFLTFSCVSYAIPLLLCATICCCLPCIIAFMGFAEEPVMQGKGAPEDVISALPTCKYQVQGGAKDNAPEGGRSGGIDCTAKTGEGHSNRNSGDESKGEDNRGKNVAEVENGGAAVAGLLWAGTEQERLVSGEDALCCICLAPYSHGDELRELPCSHHFHVSCVDTWLRINASCPLCKHELSDGDQNTPGTRTQERNSTQLPV